MPALQCRTSVIAGTGASHIIMTSLKGQDILALSFMTFALFVGAGNIIFPPMIGLQAGPYVWTAALGFLLTAVGLPVLTLVALARVGGSMAALSQPIGQRAGVWLAAVCYLLVGPLFAIPRTATASFEVGLAPLFGDSSQALALYSLVYFLLVLLVSFYPGRLLDTVGRWLAPLKILALSVLGVAVFLLHGADPSAALDVYRDAPFAQGALGGYQTMDTLGALVFGIVIVNAIRSRGVASPQLLARYVSIAGLIAGAGLAMVYLTLFQLGADSHGLAPQASNGAAVLHAYVDHIFGGVGSLFLAALMFLACLTTAVGLTCACAEHFSRALRLPYRALVWGLSLCALLISNLGLSQLTHLAEPVLIAIYPPCIVMVLLSFSARVWHRPGRVMGPAMAVALLCGVWQALHLRWLVLPFEAAWSALPLATLGLAWLAPVGLTVVLASIVDVCMGRRTHTGQGAGA